MSRALKYTIPFASLNGTQYVANVYVEGFTGTSTTLTASDNPFTTSEKNDKEWLTIPVRTQTGYLRVVCGEDEWRGLIPSNATSHYVELKQGDDVKWFGFIKPETFTHSLYSGTDEYEFPIQCPFSLLNGIHLEWDDAHSSDTFATLISRLLSLTGVTFGNCYFTNNLANLFDDLLASSNLIQWFSDETRMVNGIGSSKIEEHYLTPSATALEILQAVCQFWGWECHLWGTDIYFTAHDEHTGYRKIPFSALTTLTTSYQMRLTAAGHISVEDANYMTDKHQVEVDLPAREIVVKTDVNEVDDIMDIDIDAVAQFEELPYGWNPSSDSSRIIAKCQALRIDYDPAVEIPGMTVKFEGEQGLDEEIAQAMDNANKGDFYGPVFQRISDFPSDTNPIPIKYDLATYIFMLPATGASTGETAKLTFETLAEYDFENCAISIHGDVFSNIAISYNSGVRLAFHVSIGDYSYNALSPDPLLSPGWVQRDAIAAVPIGLNTSNSEESQNVTIMNISPGTVKIKTRWDTPYQGAEGYVIPITTHMHGKLKISLEWSQEYYQNVISASAPQYLRLSNFGVDIVREQYAGAVQRERTDSREYKQSISTDSSQNITVDLRYATDNYNAYGTAFVCTKENAYMGNLSYRDGDSERPEQHLLGRLVSLYSTPTEWREIDVDDSAADYTGPAFALLDQDGVYWAPVAVTRNWVDNIARITIGKVGTWTPPANYTLADCYDTIICDSSGNPFVVVGS